MRHEEKTQNLLSKYFWPKQVNVQSGVSLPLIIMRGGGGSALVLTCCISDDYEICGHHKGSYIY